MAITKAERETFEKIRAKMADEEQKAVAEFGAFMASEEGGVAFLSVIQGFADRCVPGSHPAVQLNNILSVSNSVRNQFPVQPVLGEELNRPVVLEG